MSHRWLLPLLAMIAAPAGAAPTDITVRVLSEGAKFVGTTMGGVEIVLRDARSGAILAQGRTEGSTGDTARIMAPAPRLARRADAGAAAFRARIDIAEPTLVQLEAYGPIAQPQAAVRVTAQRWILPGLAQDIGDGWVVELPGLVVDAVAPAAHQRLGNRTVALVANVSMMCGCPIEPGSLWDAARFEVEAELASRAGRRRVPLAYAGETGRFAADLTDVAPGDYLVTVTAVDRDSGATGVDRTSFLMR